MEDKDHSLANEISICTISIINQFIYEAVYYQFLLTDVYHHMLEVNERKSFEVTKKCCQVS